MTRALRWRWHTFGLDHVPTAGPAVITWNHHSPLDFLTVACDVYLELGRPVRPLVARRFVEHPAIGWAMRWVGAIPVGGDDGEVLQRAADAIADGHLVLIAPEGQLSTDGAVGPFRTGAARLAADTGAPLVPSAGWGTQRILAPGHRRLGAAWRLDVGVSFGAPIGSEGSAEDTTERLRDRTVQLLVELRSRVEGAP